MRQHRRIAVLTAGLALVLLCPSLAGAHGKRVNITLDLGAAAPFGPGLTETTFRQFPSWADSCNVQDDPYYGNGPGYDGTISICNPAVFGFDMGLALDIMLNIPLGFGLGYKMTIFGRSVDPTYSNIPDIDDPTQAGQDNKGDTSAYIAHNIHAIIKLRLLDMAKNYKRKWGSFDLDITLGYVRLYGTESYFQLGQGLSYMFATGELFQIGLYLQFVEAIALDKRKTVGEVTWTDPAAGSGVIEQTAGNLNDVWMAFGLRMSFSFVDIGDKPDEGGEGEFGEGGDSDYAEQMKLMDSDGDGLSDYSEMMLGTSSTNKDSDGDTIPDGTEDANLNGVRDAGETDPSQYDTDQGGANDGWEIQNGYNPLDYEDDDRDQDGVIDDQDACPGSEFGAEVGSTGCQTLTETVQLDQVTFVEGTSELNPEAYVQLDTYAMILLQDPDLEVVLLVFGPPTGNKKKVQSLTEEQAQAIRDYLVLRGVNEENVIISGEGKAPDGPRVELQPIIPLF